MQEVQSSILGCPLCASVDFFVLPELCIIIINIITVDVIITVMIIYVIVIITCMGEKNDHHCCYDMIYN